VVLIKEDMLHIAKALHEQNVSVFGITDSILAPIL
jgi:hypothetical protein